MENKKQRRWRTTKADAVFYFIILLIILSFSSIQLSSIQKNEIIRDSPECILELKQDYCAIYNMTYGSTVMMTGLFSKNAQTIEICYDDVNEFRLYRSDIDVYACENYKLLQYGSPCETPCCSCDEHNNCVSINCSGIFDTY